MHDGRVSVRTSAATPHAAVADRRAAVLLAGAIVLFAAIGVFSPLADPDLPWHLATGEWVMAHGAVPRTDPFSHTFAGQPWRATDWAADTLLAALNRAGGLPALYAATAVLVVLIMAIPVLRMRRAPLVSVLLATATLMLIYGAAAFRFTVRPQTFMMLFAGLEVLLFERAAAPGGRRWAWLVPPLLVVWSNIHASSFIGCALLGAYCAGRLFALRRGPWNAAKGEVATWIGVGVTGLVAVFVAPDPFGRLVAAQDTFFTSYFAHRISEWKPPPVAWLWGPPGILGALALAGFVADRRRVQAWELLVHGLTAWLAIRALRFVPLVALVSGPAGYAHLAAALARRGWPGASRRGARLDRGGAVLVVAVAFFVAFGLDVAHPWLSEVRRPRTGLSPEVYPVGAAEFVARERLQGNMYNSFNFGGYLIRRLAPAQKVFVDGRLTTVYSVPFLQDVIGMDPAAWQPFFARYQIAYAVIEHDVLSALLDAHPGWALVYFDDVASVYVATDGSNAEVAERRAYRAFSPPRVLGAAALERQPPERLAAMLAEADRAVAEAPQAGMPVGLRALVQAARGDQAGFAADLEAALARNRRLPLFWYKLGLLHWRAGRTREAREALAEAVALRPEFTNARRSLVRAHLAAGDFRAARSAAGPLADGRDVETVLREIRAARD
jgi:hypothetical protein